MISRQDSHLFTLECRDQVALIWIDVPGASVNTLRAGFDGSLHQILDEIEAMSDPRAVVLASAKETSFVVGADLALLDALEGAGDGAELARGAHRVLDRLAGFELPVVAAIHGACLGGGLELALACHARLASDSDETRLGLPEVRLGLIPGAGGTQRLPRVVGLEEALKLILGGTRLPPEAALHKGLVDEVVHPAVLVEAAIKRALELAETSAERDRSEQSLGGARAIGDLRSREFRSLLLEDNPAGRALLFKKSHEKTMAKTGGNMPAPLRALEVIRLGAEKGMEAGLQAEATAFGELAVSPESRNLRRLFQFRQELKHESAVEAEARPVRKLGVVGAGLMGGGIARVSAEKAGLPVRLKDLAAEVLGETLGAIRRDLDFQVERHRLEARERDRVMARLHPTTGSSGFGRADVVIEAVVEDEEVKRSVRDEVFEHGHEKTVFASNTSSIPITRLAAGAAAPERVVGMHYFSPVDKVPLLEVVRAEQTAPWVVASAVELGRRQGKTVIVVNDGTGFYTSRILAPYLNEAVRLVAEGVPVETIDEALSGFGFPVGPLQLLDEVGLDVARKIGAILHEDFGERLAPAELQDKLVEDERLGRKNGCGFYRYEKSDTGFERSDGADDSIWELVGRAPGNELPGAEQIALRCALPLLAEAVRCLDEGIVGSARDADVGAVFGLGFPPFLGGPLRFIDERGLERTRDELEEHRSRLGQRFAVPESLDRMAEARESFYAARNS